MKFFIGFVFLTMNTLIFASTTAPNFSIELLGEYVGVGGISNVNKISPQGGLLATYNDNNAIYCGAHIFPSGEAMCLPVLDDEDNRPTGESWPLDINDHGVIVGRALHKTDVSLLGDGFPVRWMNGHAENLTPNIRGRAEGINNLGQIVGFNWIHDDAEDMTAFLWDNGTLTTLSPLLGFDSTMAIEINDSGLIIGNSYSINHAAATVWKAGNPHPLKPLKGFKDSFATDLNQYGISVGNSVSKTDAYDQTLLATLWNEDGRSESLGTLNQGDSSFAAAINNNGWIVGYSTPGSHAVLWIEKKIYDLNDLIPEDSPWKIDTAIAINDSGIIVALGTAKRGNKLIRSFLLRPQAIKAPESSGK